MKTLKMTLLASCIASTACAHAQTPQYSVEAPVVGVTPLVRTVTEKIPHESCWDETVREVRHGRNHAKAPTVLGAIIGGVAGGAIGKNNRNQPILAGAGAALGAAIAHDNSRRHSAKVNYVTQRRCEVDYELRDREEITGYRVAYEYSGNVYYTRTQYQPGSTIRVNVHLEPANGY